nr:MAG TPA: hypothetical protein [Caudoviricetes sp.]
MDFVIYSKRLRNYLLNSGFKETRKPEHNLKFPKFLVFFFEDTDKLRDKIKEYKNVQ